MKILVVPNGQPVGTTLTKVCSLLLSPIIPLAKLESKLYYLVMSTPEYQKAYREKNKEKLREQKKRYYLKNREQFLFKASLFLKENKEKILEYQKKILSYK